MTRRPELALAVNAGAALVKGVSAGWANVRLLLPLVIANVSVTGAAADQETVAACDAVIEQIPPATKVMTPFLTVQMPDELEAKLTG